MTAIARSRHGDAGGERRLVDAHFAAAAGYWRDVYRGRDLQSAIYRRRRAVVLALARRVGTAPGARVLDVGCGAGSLAVALARRGHLVDAVDTVQSMVAGTGRRAEAAGVGGRVRVRLADVGHLPFADDAFALVLAVGLTPWVPALPEALREMVRVLAPGGHLIVTADNRWRLNHVLDPRWFPVLAPLRAATRDTVARLRPRATPPPRVRQHLYAVPAFDRLLAAAGVGKVQGLTVGFGPFSFCGARLLPRAAGMRVHRFLQGLADRGVPGLRVAGAQYVVLARKGSVTA